MTHRNSVSPSPLCCLCCPLFNPLFHLHPAAIPKLSVIEEQEGKIAKKRGMITGLTNIGELAGPMQRGEYHSANEPQQSGDVNLKIPRVSRELTNAPMMPKLPVGPVLAAVRRTGLVSIGRLCHRKTPILVLLGHFRALSLTGSGGTDPVPGDSCNSG